MKVTATVPENTRIILWGDQGVYLGRDSGGGHVMTVVGHGEVHLPDSVFERALGSGELEVVR